MIFNVYGIAEGEDEPFDMSLLQGKNETVYLGNEEISIMRGVEIGLLSMKKNETSKFIISPQYALGRKGCPPRIPAGNYTTLTFDV